MTKNKRSALDERGKKGKDKLQIHDDTGRVNLNRDSSDQYNNRVRSEREKGMPKTPKKKK